MATAPAISLENIQFPYASGSQRTSRCEDAGATNIHSRSQLPHASPSISHPSSTALSLPKHDPIVLDEAKTPAETQIPQLERKSFDSTSISGQVFDASARAQSTSHNTTGAIIQVKRRRSLQKEYPVKAILGSKIVKTKKGDLRLKYEVGWETSWESSENLECEDLVTEFHATNPKAPSPADLTEVAKRKMAVPEEANPKRLVLALKYFAENFKHETKRPGKTWAGKNDSRTVPWGASGKYVGKSTLLALGRNVTGLELPEILYENTTFEAKESKESEYDVVLGTNLRQALREAEHQENHMEEKGGIATVPLDN
ncbi:hypothetical protein ACJ72_04640 [Emergomyces africanus]|uniref:Chromo domain-containing protein n=1 Tax=Emergomyces africanus TaxID=1955775 RepID=A0A1B7NW61_9EURO|nr:hypothetical protein ACJ72_04640 [Emergomyces africanus]